MRRYTSWSAATAVALVIGVLAAPATGADEPEALPAAPLSTTDGSARATGLIVTGAGSGTALRSAAADDLAGDTSIDGVTAGPGRTRVISFDEAVPAAVAERLADDLESRSDVTAAEPDYVRTIADAPPVQVNDQYFPQQTSIWDPSRPAGGYSSRAPAFWTRTMGTPNIRVAVLDTGKIAHPDLVWADGYDVVDGDNDPTDPGSAGTGRLGDFHGTHVAGTVGARANNGIGVAGVAPGVTVVPVRVLDGQGNGSDSTIAAGILWAATNPVPVQVITMSLAGVGGCGPTLANAINVARSRGIVVIAAAGNDGADARGYAPASCPGVIAVGATDAGGARAPFSNYGSVVDISAPGTNVLSTAARRAANGGVEVGWATQSGTSMAAPAVAGAAALLASTGLSGQQIEARLPLQVSPATTPGTPGVLDLRPRIATKVSVKTTSKVKKGKRAVLRVKLRAATGARPSGRIRVYDGHKIVKRVTVASWRKGNITIKTPRLKKKGTHKLRVVYLGEGVFSAKKSVIRKVRVR